MLEITGSHIKELNDTDLRELVGRLCEADLRSEGLQTNAVTWGGHQNAKDGGIDVRVEMESEVNNDNYIPRGNTGFQVKKPDMPRNEILKEMSPNGELRQVIKELVDCEGAYIIISSQGSTSDSSLRNRRDAMREALSKYPNNSNMKVDFYDRERIASWVRCHPSMILWVRDVIGQPIHGWKSFQNWAKCPGGIVEEYILDENMKLYNSATFRPDKYSAVDGINKLRNILRRSGSCVRLVGLSGVGKTRLLQCLFDERIGQEALNESQVFYTDIGCNPSSEPYRFLERLHSLQQPGIVAIDNCPPNLHRQLTEICSSPGSLMSLITIEYDIREDQPEETEVFRLEPSSDELIEKVLLTRFKKMSQVDAHTIAEISGGNARVAIALGNTVKSGESLANLKDEELFNRLFQQRNESDDSLMQVAEICSLVYSFDGETIGGDSSELETLSSLINMSSNQTYRHISELSRRELVQQRGIWRAVLPHAVSK